MNLPGMSENPMRASGGPGVHAARSLPGDSGEKTTARCPGHAIFRAAAWGAKGTALLVGLAGLKCVVLYVVLPALAVNWFISRTSADPAEEPAHAAKVPASCPFHAQSKPGTGAPGALGAAQGRDPAAAR